MAGYAKTSQVLLSTATVMLGAQEDLLELNPARHSLGLVKNVTLTMDPEFRELTQGITNDVVMSVKVADGSRIAMEVYEYTMRNLAYAAGLDGSVTKYDTMTAVQTTASAPSGVTLDFAAPPTDIATGDFISIQGDEDLVHIGKVLSVAANEVTLEADYAIPVGMTFPAATKVQKVHSIDIGAQTPQANLAAKITGFIDPTRMQPVTILIPKCRITRGFNLNFTTDNYGNMPFEITPYAQTPSDPMYDEFGSTKIKLLKA